MESFLGARLLGSGTRTAVLCPSRWRCDPVHEYTADPHDPPASIGLVGGLVSHFAFPTTAFAQPQNSTGAEPRPGRSERRRRNDHNL